MKRGLVFTLCALAVAASASLGRAQTIDLSLNLRFNDPANPTAGGVWYLTARTSGGATNAGIAGVSAYLLGINPVAFHGSSVTLPAGQNPAHGAYPAVGQATINNLNNGGNPYNGATSGAHNVVYGQDISTGPPAPPAIITGIGQGSGAGNVAVDPLRNPAYNNYAVLLSGTFPGGATAATLPRFAPMSGGTITGGNVLVNGTAGTAAIAATIAASNLHVRGDSLGSLNLNAAPGQGLRGGDANRDGIVNGLDFSILSANFSPPSTGVKGWDQGNFNSNTGGSSVTNGLDFSILSANFSPPNGPGVPPAISAIPEPASAALLSMALLGLVLRAKRR